MSRSVAWSLAIRYLKTRRKQFAAFITWVSLLGLALGVLVLTVVVSVMNGFDRELKTRILGTVPHILLEGVTLADARVAEVGDFDEVLNVYEFFLGAGMLTRSGAVNPVAIYGIDPADAEALQSISANMLEGSLSELRGEGRRIVMGAPLAFRLGLRPFQTTPTFRDGNMASDGAMREASTQRAIWRRARKRARESE